MENKCNFCNMTETNVEVLISDTEERIFICNNCVNNISLYLENKTPNKEKEIKNKEVINDIINHYVSTISKADNFKDLMIITEDAYNNMLHYLNDIDKKINQKEEKIKVIEDSKKHLLMLIKSTLKEKTKIFSFDKIEEVKETTFLEMLLKESDEKYNELFEIIYSEIEMELITLKEEYKNIKQNENSIILNEDYKRLKPIDFKEKLDEYVVGQEHSKKTLSIAAASHLKRISTDLQLPKSNVLLIGPTGSGKTLLIKTISELLDLPLITVDATSFTSAGYKGNDVSNILASLYRKSKGNTEEEKKINTEKGIVFIDEFDKLKSREDQFINTERVQQELLKIIEGTEVEINVSESDMMEHYITLDTKNILFVFSGAFVGLDKIKEKRTNKESKTITFSDMNFKETEKVQKITSEDLINYGIIPELIGRIPYISELQKLSVKELFEISSNIKNSPIELYTNSFKMDEKELNFEKEALIFVAEEAHKLNVGGRGLQNIIDTVLFDFLYDIHNLEEKINIDINYVKSKFYLTKEENE